MNKYESVIIIRASLDDEQINAVVTKIINLINKNGKVEKVENNGKKKLAYEIDKCKEGYYIIFYFETESNFIKELERQYRITEEIIKFITVRKDN